MHDVGFGEELLGARRRVVAEAQPAAVQLGPDALRVEQAELADLGGVAVLGDVGVAVDRQRAISDEIRSAWLVAGAGRPRREGRRPVRTRSRPLPDEASRKTCSGRLDAASASTRTALQTSAIASAAPGVIEEAV